MRLAPRGSVAARPARTKTLAVAVLAPLLLIGSTVATGDVASAEPAAPAAAKRMKPVTFELASFNILGSNHTTRSRYWQPGRVRAQLAKRWLEAEGTSVVGLQESQVDQVKALTADGKWSSYPRPNSSSNTETAQSVAWRTNQWKMVRAHNYRIPFDNTQVRKQPVVQLKHRATGRKIWVISVHLTAGGGSRGAWERRVGTDRTIRKANALRRTGVPVLVTGDMNSYGEFACPVMKRTALRSPAGGSFRNGRCALPRTMRIDWIFGSPRVRWSNFRFADGGVLDRITDHTVPMTHVRLG